MESKKARKQKISPHVIAYLSATEDHRMHVLRLKNIGEGLAKNVKVNVLEDYKQFSGKGSFISEIGIVQNGLNFFPPNHELQFYLDNPVDISNNHPDGIISLEISYENIYNKQHKETFELPFNQIFGQNYSDPPETYIGKVAFYLKKISHTLEKRESSNVNKK